jgi:hypothetical protein
MKESEAARARFIAKQVALARARMIAAHKFFNARNKAGVMARWSKIFARRAKKAGSFKNLMIMFHAKSVKHHAAMKAKRAVAMTKWLAARRANAAAVAAKRAAAKAYAVSIRVAQAAKKSQAAHKAALNAKASAQKRAGAAMHAAKENYVVWAKHHRKSLSAMQRANLKKMFATRAHKAAVHKAAVAHKKHVAAVNKTRAAYRAAVKAHRKVQAHARSGFKLVL